MFETKEEAQDHIDKEVKRMSKMLCPITQERCMTIKCMAFHPGTVYEYGKTKVNGPFCLSPLVSGNVYVEVSQ